MVIDDMAVSVAYLALKVYRRPRWRGRGQGAGLRARLEDLT